MFNKQCRIRQTVNASMVNYLERSQTASLKPEELELGSFESTIYSDSEGSSDEEDEALFENRVLCGYWGVNRFEKYPWADRRQLTVRTVRYRDIKNFTGEEFHGKLTKRIITACLSYLEKSPYDLRYAYCKCKLQGKGLIDISALRSYHYIQCLNISHNCVTTLVALSEMPYLQYLDASVNNIENAFDFTPPLYLTTVNYFDNNIVIMPNLTKFWSIVYLDMSNNNIHEIRGLDGLKYLTYLNLSKNKIRMLENLNGLNIETLLLSENSICLYQTESKGIGFHTLKRLRTLDLSFNKLSSVQFLRQCYALENLTMTSNEISEFLELFYLKDLRYLKSLNLQGNKIAAMPHFRTMCLRTFKSLLYLNDEEVTAEDKVNARTKENISLLYPSHIERTQLLLLEQLKRPNTGAHVCPYDQPHPYVIIIVGPPGSRKRDIAMNFVAESSLLKLGVSYTTRPNGNNEIHGRDFYFIKHADFIRMLNNAEFLSISEFNGYLYGITHEELKKGINSILVFFSDLETALVLKMAGINPEIVLAIPRDEHLHRQWIKDNYFIDVPTKSSTDIMSNKHCLPGSQAVVRIHHINQDDDDTYSELSEDSSLMTEQSMSFEESNTSQEFNNQSDDALENPDQFIYKTSHSESSLKSCPLDLESQRQIPRVSSLKLSESSGDHHRKNLIYKTSLPDDTENIKSTESRKHSNGDVYEQNDEAVKEWRKVDYENSEYSATVSMGSNENHQKTKKEDYELGSQKYKDKFGKRVSFNWFALPEETSTDGSFQRNAVKSVSNAHVFAGLDARFDANPLLSVLSSSKIEIFNQGRSSKTVYTSLSERLDSFKSEKLSSFYSYVLNVRRKLLELHYQNPGLFHTVIFTDNPEECICTLKNLAKIMTDNMEVMNKWQVGPDSFENHPQFKEVVNRRLNIINLHENTFTTVYDDLQIT